jgi:hypothetical protein
MLDGRASPSLPAFLACMLQMPITFFPLVPTPQSAINVIYINGKFMLYAINEATLFQAAKFLANMQAKII